ncbi:hypothetical protein OZY48_03275 [Aliarcobacter cryaerophilus]|uniref:hypothetical protein n=1 Tax=Aliarcobacter cryaerophilus TaxID=28198 RepID=UPI003BAFD008
MEDILDSIEEENIANLFRLKNRVYNETFKSYIFIFNQIKNINFSSKIKYEDIDFTTYVLDKNIDSFLLQENIYFTGEELKSLDRELNQRLQKLSEIVTNCNDYFKLNKENKELVKESYFMLYIYKLFALKTIIKIFLIIYLNSIQLFLRNYNIVNG